MMTPNDQPPLTAGNKLRGLMQGGGGGTPGFSGVMDPGGNQGGAQGGGPNGPPSLGALDRLGQRGAGNPAFGPRPEQLVSDQGAQGGTIPDELKLPYERVSGAAANDGNTQGVNNMTPGDGTARDMTGVMNQGADPTQARSQTSQAPAGNGPQMAHDHLRRRAMMKQAMAQGMPASLAGLHTLGFGNFGQGGY